MGLLHIPEGINFECTGCGNCCLQWPVPVTAQDRQRILAVDSSDDAELFRPLSNQPAKLKTFTHTLEKRADGRCKFLTESNRCRLHEKGGAQSKPAMCQLFPYTFNPTPSGVYASISFASTGALLNAGAPLNEQTELLQGQLQLFKDLLPGIEADWSNTQLVDGQKLSWDEYLSIDEALIKTISPLPHIRVDKKLQQAARSLYRRVAPGKDLEAVPRMEAAPKLVDLLLLKEFIRFYLPDDVFKEQAADMETRALFQQLVQPPNVVHLEMEGREFRVQQLMDARLGELDDQSEDLLYRFVYCRIFAKLYFGFGYCGLSVLAGIHHLCVLIAMVRIYIKMRQAIANQKPDFLQVAEIVRTLERRLTMASLSRESTAMLETLLLSPQRIERIIFLAS